MVKKGKKDEDRNNSGNAAVKESDAALPEKTVLEKLPKDVQEKLKVENL